MQLKLAWKLWLINQEQYLYVSSAWALIPLAPALIFYALFSDLHLAFSAYIFGLIALIDLFRLPLRNLSAIGEFSSHTRISALPIVYGLLFITIAFFLPLIPCLLLGYFFINLGMPFSKELFGSISLFVLSIAISFVGIVLYIPSIGISSVIAIALIVNLGFIQSLNPDERVRLDFFVKAKLK